MAAISALTQYGTSSDDDSGDDSVAAAPALPIAPFDSVRINDKLALAVVAAPDVLPNVRKINLQ